MNKKCGVGYFLDPVNFITSTFHSWNDMINQLNTLGQQGICFENNLVDTNHYLAIEIRKTGQRMLMVNLSITACGK